MPVPRIVSHWLIILRAVQLTVENINVEEGDESKTPLSAVLRDVPLLDGQHLGDWVEGNHLFEEVESGVAERSVWEVGDASRAWP